METRHNRPDYSLIGFTRDELSNLDNHHLTQIQLQHERSLTN